ncbi:MAG: hypothetical protein JO340_10010 [Acidobacteriaceae bacterium]|nr:hypothetical protein [Acidobacteriaceae bacterium]
MSCRPIHLSLEVNPSATEKIAFTLDCTCDANDEATWKMTFDLQEGKPLATVVKFSLEIDPVNHPQAQATADAGSLDAVQQAQARVAGAVAKNPQATQHDKHSAAQKVIAVRQMTRGVTGAE